jgi:hypothetical protein
MQHRQGCNSTRLVPPASYTTTLHHTTPVPPSPRGQAALDQPTRAGLALSLVLYRCVAVTPGSGHIRRQRYGIDDPSYLHRNSDKRVPRGAECLYTCLLLSSDYEHYYCSTVTTLACPDGSLRRNVPRRISCIPMTRHLGLPSTTRLLLLHRPR